MQCSLSPLDSEPVQWKQCKTFGGSMDQVLDAQFGNSHSTLKFTVAYSNGLVKVYEILDPMELNNWQLQFDQDHQRWLPIAELADNADKGDQVFFVAWDPNIGRPFELMAVVTSKGISIWQRASNPDLDGRLFVEIVVTFPCHDNENNRKKYRHKQKKNRKKKEEDGEKKKGEKKSKEENGVKDHEQKNKTHA
ncbi:hypothetical protein L1887_02461 [Cichorium endivia]|nr:hypothetical protein L1887_02461 [Cichorium endivia]